MYGNILAGGFAPFLKIPTPAWQSGRIAGLAYADPDPATQSLIYVLPHSDYPLAYKCKQWPKSRRSTLS